MESKQAAQLPAPSPSALIIADDHPLVRASLREAVERLLPEVRVVEAPSLSSLQEAVHAHPDSDLILLDLRMPGARGFSALIRLRAEHPSIPVAVVSGVEEPATIQRALDLGASAFIPKSASIETIGSMLRAVIEGGVALPPGHSHTLSEAAKRDRDAARRLSSLSPQQLRVLLLIEEGYPNKVIGSTLALSEATVKAYVTVILRKLGVETRTQAALLTQRILQTRGMHSGSGGDV